jgi:hypothetical protein
MGPLRAMQGRVKRFLTIKEQLLIAPGDDLLKVDFPVADASPARLDESDETRPAPREYML